MLQIIYLSNNICLVSNNICLVSNNIYMLSELSQLSSRTVTKKWVLIATIHTGSFPRDW